MTKKLLSLLLCTVLLLAMAAPTLAQEEKEVLTVTTAQQLLDLAEHCRLDSFSQGLTVVLGADIDLTDTEFTDIPIFSGIFDGAGHKITGLQLSGAGATRGFFRYLTATAVVKDLQLQALVAIEGSRERIGALAGENAGQIINCTATVDVTGGNRVGGLVGTNTVTGIIDNAQVSGTVSGDHFVGGIAGENLGVIRSCVNTALVNTTPQQNQVDISDITMDSLTNSEAISTVTDIGGIAGISSGVIRQCENQGSVGYRQMGYNIGGIAGTQSGYIVDCENHGHIQGRKEVGGIVGQMEPVTVLAYSVDALQTLEGQLGTMSQLVNQASAEAMTGTAELERQVASLQSQADAARQAADVLMGDTQDPDALLAAYNSLSDALIQMPQTLQSISATAQGTATGLTDDLISITGQVNAMGSTMQQARDNLGAVATDVSDEDTPEDLSGKVEKCRNYGDVLADMDAGGIAGAMAMETDLDVLQDFSVTGEVSLDLQLQLRLVVLDCENRGTVTGKKQNAGGIAGGQLLGLIRGCTNTGTIEAEGAEYVGGICGISAGKLRENRAKCQITAGAYAGGIAGSALTVTDSIAITKLLDATEKTGGILGWMEPAQNVECQENYYLPVEGDLGGIDGISYEAAAQALTLEEFLQLKGLPESMKTVTVRFVQEDGTETQVPVPLGGQLEEAQIPAIPEQSGSSGRWEELEDASLTRILFDMSFQAVYTPYSATIRSEQTSPDGRPLVLAEGAFTKNAAVSVQALDASPQVQGEQLLESWQLTLTEPADTVRFLLPEDAAADRLVLRVLDQDGTWRKTEFSVDGSYGVFTPPEGITGFAIVRTAFPYWIVAVIVVAILAAAAVTAVYILKKKKAKPQAQA